MDNGFFLFSLLSLIFPAIVLFIPVIAVWAIITVRAQKLQRQFRERQTPAERVGGSDIVSGLDARLNSLEQQVRELRGLVMSLSGEARLAAPPGALPTETKQTHLQEASVPIEQSAQIATPPNLSYSAASNPQATGLDMEQLIAGRWLNRIGVVALLLAVSFFLKYAFDNDWIGPRGQVASGLLGGAAILIYSQWLLHRGHAEFANRIAGLGGGVLYLSLFAGSNYHHFFPLPLGFGGMAAVTVTLVIIAVKRDSQAMALVGLLGGLLTPVLLSTGRDAPVELFTYLALLNAGILLIARARQWPKVEWLAFGGTMFYFWGWWNGHYHADRRNLTTGFATLFFLEFAVLPVLQARRFGALGAAQTTLVVLNALGYLAALQRLLYDEQRVTLSAMLLLLAGVHLAIVRWLPMSEASPSLVRLLFGGLALTFVTLVIPVQLDGKWISMAWAIEGAILIVVGFRTQIAHLRSAGLALFAVVVGRLVLFPVHGTQPLLINQRFGLFAVVIVCLATALWRSRSHKSELREEERAAFGVVGLFVNILALWALSCEVWDYGGSSGAEEGRRSDFAQQLGLSLLWTAYATGLVAAGVRWANKALRWQGLALLGVVTAKVFLYDLSSLEAIYRIVSFTVLGVLVLGISFFYQRAASNYSVKEMP